ncbi:MAG: cyclase family protein [Firmicutes bacterium]|nr:cyclase family protein [Bacillota bacterium]
MKIYDITQEVFSCVVFPGDPAPEREILLETAKGDVCNLSKFSMCAHNGTHVDAPYHFIQNGKKLDEVPLDTWIGSAYVAEFEGTIAPDDIRRILHGLDEAAASSGIEIKKLLIKGKATLSYEAAEVLLSEGKIELFGNESQTVGPEDAPAAVHRLLLGAGMVFLEGIRLGAVPEGVYLLNAAPLHLGGSDGAPCRAVLLKL